MKCRLITALPLILAGACAKKAPEVKATPIDIAMQIAQQAEAHIDSIQPGAIIMRGTIVFVEPSETDYVNLIVAAAGWARKSYRSLGVLQQTSGHPLWQHASAAATQKYALRPIQLSDFQTVCGQPERQQTSITQQKQICTMKYVDVVMQFNGVRMTRDSGYVALSLTRVPTGGNRAETTYQCVTLARKGREWDARHSARIVDHTRCPRP
jgi:hypothetical protein